MEVCLLGLFEHVLDNYWFQNKEEENAAHIWLWEEMSEKQIRNSSQLKRSYFLQLFQKLLAFDSVQSFALIWDASFQFDDQHLAPT